MMEPSEKKSIRNLLIQRLDVIESRIQAACLRSGRSRKDVTLVAVTKTVSPEIASILPEIGIFDLGENRPQELWRKAGELPSSVRWHLIGHLQRNKIEKSIPMITLIHSVDSIRLLQALESEGKPVEILLEINASGEESKQGFDPDEISNHVLTLAGLKNVKLRGLMTMARHEEDPEKCRPTFARLRQLRDLLQDQLGSQTSLDSLSMGMSNDFEIAIEEGATLIRLGSVLLGDLPANPPGN